jgi:hypothetical protein
MRIRTKPRIRKWGNMWVCGIVFIGELDPKTRWYFGLGDTPQIAYYNFIENNLVK